MQEKVPINISQLMVSVRHFADAARLMERDVEELGGMCWGADESCVEHMTAAAHHMQEAVGELEAAMSSLGRFRVEHHVK